MSAPLPPLPTLAENVESEFTITKFRDFLSTLDQTDLLFNQRSATMCSLSTYARFLDYENPKIQIDTHTDVSVMSVGHAWDGRSNVRLPEWTFHYQKNAYNGRHEEWSVQELLEVLANVEHDAASENN